jgi:hypothetical protein
MPLMLPVACRGGQQLNVTFTGSDIFSVQPVNAVAVILEKLGCAGGVGGHVRTSFAAGARSRSVGAGWR